MTDKWSQAQVLEALRVGWGQWEALLVEVGEARMAESITAAGWSAKDLIAHVTWYEQQMNHLLRPHTGPGPPRDWLWAFTADKRDAILFAADQDRLLSDVRAEAREVHAQLIAAVQALTMQNLRDPQRFPDMPRGWQPWQVIARHSYEHYQEHIPDIRAWLAMLKAEPAPGIFGSTD